MMMAIVNLIQRRDNKPEPIRPFAVRYDSWWLWDRAKEIDYWPDTNPGDSNGTSVSAAMDVLRAQGHVQVPNTSNGRASDPSPLIINGIQMNRWAQTVDEMRTSIANGVPVSIGVNWYSNFDRPVEKSYNNFWIGEGSLGNIRGGHCVCVYGVSDKRQAFRVKNSWGRGYPLVWMPYSTMARLLNEDGEATIITDR
jgi:C1A family cysteine protease